MARDCFLEPDQLLRDAHKIKDIPVVIINGRYDVICPPKTAYKLHQAPWIVEAASHVGGEPGIQAAIVKAVKTFE